MPADERVIRFLARYSEGLRLAVNHGPTSGTVLEYAYDNTPQGSGPVGRWIDRRFLHLQPWEDIRQRFETIQQIIADAVEQRRLADLPTFVLAVASGSARYLRELVREHGGADLTVACRDRHLHEVTHGRQLAAAEGLGGISFEIGDPLDQASYLTAEDPDLIVAVGLFPGLARDRDVQKVINLAYRHLSRGGYFICDTFADAHPSLANWALTALRAPITIRSPAQIASWMQSVGFQMAGDPTHQHNGIALVGHKPS